MGFRKGSVIFGEVLMTGAGSGECLGVSFGIGGTELAACQKKCDLHCY